MKSQEIETLGGEFVATYDHPSHIGESDWTITLYSMPTGNYAIGTNGDPIYEDDRGWAEAKGIYGF